MTLLLTLIALKFTVTGSLPNVPYHTLIDHFFSISATALAGMTVLSIIPQFFAETNQVRMNYLVTAVSFVYVVGGMILWLRYAEEREKAEISGSEMVETVPNAKNFYCYRYASAPFLDNSKLARHEVNGVYLNPEV